MNAETFILRAGAVIGFGILAIPFTLAKHWYVILPLYIGLSYALMLRIKYSPPPPAPVPFDRTYAVEAFKIRPAYPTSKRTSTSRRTEHESYSEETSTDAIPQFGLHFILRAFGKVHLDKLTEVDAEMQRGLAVWKVLHRDAEAARDAILTVESSLQDGFAATGFDLKVKLVWFAHDDLTSAPPGDVAKPGVFVQLL